MFKNIYGNMQTVYSPYLQHSDSNGFIFQHIEKVKKNTLVINQITKQRNSM